MTPDDNARAAREAFDALPGGTPPPGLDTRIRTAAHNAVKPSRRRALPALAGSLATVALAVFLARPLWLASPDPLADAAPASAKVQPQTEESAELATTESVVAMADQTDTGAASNRPITVQPAMGESAAAVADTRGSTFSAKRSLGTQADRAPAPTPEVAHSSVQMDAQLLAESALAAPATKSVPADTWWKQLVTLHAHGHTEKAKREFRLLMKTYPAFTPPEDTPKTLLHALDAGNGS